MVRGNQGTKPGLTLSQMHLENKLQEKIHQYLLERHSESSTASSDSFVSFFEDEAEEEPNILDTLLLTDTESVEDEEPEYVQQKSLTPEEDIFQVLEEVTNLENISVDISVASEPIERLTITTKDIGMFVNPLTGLVIEESVKSVPSIVHEEDKNEPPTEVHEDSIYVHDTSSTISLSSKSSEGQDKIGKNVENLMDETYETFMEMHKKIKTEEAPKIDLKALELEEEMRLIRIYITKFLDELINQVVHVSEVKSPEKFLQQNLDKRKLLLELVAKISNLQSEKNVCDFLNHRVVLHFRRKRSYRSIMEDSPKTLSQNKFKLQQANKKLDQALSKENKLIQMSTEIRDKLTKQCDKLRQEAETKVEEFEKIVRNHICRENTPKTNADVNRLLVTMKRYRQEVSEVRLTLLLQQHQEAKLSDTIKQMENLGNDLTVKQYVTLQAEVQELDKRIEERNLDLAKLHFGNHNNYHTSAHFKENQQMLIQAVTLQRALLQEMVNDRQLLRERLVSLKMQHNRIHADIRSLSAQSGLLDKPALMYDYDNTIKILEAQKRLVEFLKATLLSTQQKIDHILKTSSNV